MFTGIVEELGVVAAVEPRTGAATLTLTIACKKILDDVTHGASIAVNGVCLTVTSFSGQSTQHVEQVPVGPGAGERWFTADVMKETLDRTSLGGLAVGDPVNLERPVRLMDRLGGHIVQGHVDGVGTVVERHHGPHWDTVHFSLPPGLDRYLVEKGSVTVDGVSLTVVDVTPGSPTVTAPRTPAGVAAPTPGAMATLGAPKIAMAMPTTLPTTEHPAAAGIATATPATEATAASDTATSASTTDSGGVPASFTVGLIPTTLAETTLGRRMVGDLVNIEVDVLAKYIEKLSADAPALNGTPR